MTGSLRTGILCNRHQSIRGGQRSTGRGWRIFAVICLAGAGRARLLGSNQVMGFLKMGDIMLAMHYPYAERKVVLQREHNCAEFMRLRSGCTDRGTCSAGTAMRPSTAR